MRRITSTLVALTLMWANLNAQLVEVGGFMGISNYAGDLTPKSIEKEEYKLAYGLLARYNKSHHLSFRFGLYKSTIAGSDVHSEGIAGRRKRNLSFQSDIYEASLVAEINMLGYNVLENITQFTPYGFLGITGFYHNPRAYLDNKWYDLQPLGTEGQGMAGYAEKYKRFQIAIPMGVGFKVSLSEAVNVAIEVGARKTFTDYLDDVSTNYPDLQQYLEEGELAGVALSYRTPEYEADATPNPNGLQRGNPDAKDWYFVSGISLTFNLGVGRLGYGSSPHALPKF